MVKRIVGFDDKDKIVFERNARDYDRGIANTMFGVTVGDILKTIPVIIACVMIYANQTHINEKIMFQTSENAQAIGGIKEVLNNLNNYLSSSTGKQFENGRPR